MSDRAVRRIGLRTTELVRDAGSFGLRINGTVIFAKGANLIPFDNFPARVTAQQMRSVLRGAREANMNMIRVWGGGYYLDDAFYDMADEMGLMIWQDFMFGGAVTPPDAAFRETVRIEAEEQVDRLQAHPSIVIWAGNNEVQIGLGELVGSQGVQDSGRPGRAGADRCRHGGAVRSRAARRGRRQIARRAVLARIALDRL